MTGLLRNPWLRLLLGVAALALVVWLVVVSKDALAPFVIAFALAYLLNPLVNSLESFFARDIARSRLVRGRLTPRAAAIGLLIVGLLLVALVFVLVVVPTFYHQAADAVAKLPEYGHRLRVKLEPLRERLNLRYPEQYEELRRRVESEAKERLPQLLSPIPAAVGRAFSSALSLVLALLNLAVIPIFAAYLLYDMNRIREGGKELVPERFRPYVYTRVGEVDRLLAAFVRGQLTVALILGTFYALALSAVGLPLGLLVGFGIGFFNLIPFMSYVAGLPLALLLSWVDDQSWPRLVIVAAIFTFGQFVEGNFITPRVVGKSLGLHAVVIMLAVLLGGTLFGFLGMLLAVPVTAALSVFWRDLRQAYLGSAFYRGEA